MTGSQPAAQSHAAVFKGRLIDNGEARWKVVDADGRQLPCLVLHVETDSQLHMPLTVEQLFDPGRMDQAKAAAHRYRKGQHVTVEAPLLSVRMAVTATHIHTEKQEETEHP